VATIEDLYDVPGKAELVRGEVAHIPLDGDMPNRASGAIGLRLREYERSSRSGRAYAGTAVFRVHLPHRDSFSPDAAYYVGPRAGGKFLEGAPIFAAEVRSEGDYGESAEAALAGKRGDYFAAGTKVVWDVDVLGDEIVRVFRATEPESRESTGAGKSPRRSPPSRDFEWPSTSFSNSRDRLDVLTFLDPPLE
jgi:Uma2 family endonuclease